MAELRGITNIKSCFIKCLTLLCSIGLVALLLILGCQPQPTQPSTVPSTTLEPSTVPPITPEPSTMPPTTPEPSTVPPTTPETGTIIAEVDQAYEETNLEDATNIIGLTLPLPTYLPEGYEIREVYIWAEGRDLILLISDKEIEKELVTFTVYAGGTPYQTRQRWDCKCKMEMIIGCPAGGGLKMPWAERVEIGQIPGRWVTGDESNSLWWQIKATPGEEDLVEIASFEIVLRAGKNISKEEMVKIAESSLWENREA